MTVQLANLYNVSKESAIVKFYTSEGVEELEFPCFDDAVVYLIQCGLTIKNSTEMENGYYSFWFEKA